MEQEPGRHASAKLLTHDEAWRIAANVAKLPGCSLRRDKRVEQQPKAKPLSRVRIGDLAGMPRLMRAPCPQQTGIRGSDAVMAPTCPQFGHTIRVTPPRP